MAWWTTQFIFRDETLISEGVEPPWLQEVEWVVQEPGEGPGEGYTRVIVSGYALYGELRGYYALGVAHWCLDPKKGRAFLSEASQRNSEPVASLTPRQRAVLRECLMRLNPEAWETSHISLRKQLES